MTLDLKYDEDSTYKPIYLELEPNKHFSYCVRPGTYTIDKIEFSIKENLDESIRIPTIKFRAEVDKSNYLGNIHLVNNISDSSGCIKIPYKIVHNPNEIGIALMFGLVGTAIYQGLKKSDIDGYYLLKVSNDSSFEFSSTREHIISLIHQN